MTSLRSWFNQGPMHQLFQPGKIIHLSPPQESQWRINEIIKEYDNQRDQRNVRKDVPSYAAIKLSCSKADDPTSRAMMRVYVQIPHTNTEPKIRAQQAIRFKPKELHAFQTLSKNITTSNFTPSLLGYRESEQDASGMIPGGFLTFIVWQIVPGLWLGSPSGEATGFWDSGLDLEERNLIRAKFKDTFHFWVGFRNWDSSTPGPGRWTEFWWYYFGLAKVDGYDNHPMDDEWDGDTSTWHW
ncbi:uncharacterized protein N7483_008012 [Penicillium malachiteum]|uniref:uncharacterized protein n=1 Tax=Penicillium malachiteum TaxID=1324776 RepID=UPI00254949E6|nr:uncharacterized protein N7483_008012 [Penicillium malachiteum]KAJ5726655.1 hypothetical protein N7483_008012 [Penicillium malachiteum]